MALTLPPLPFDSKALEPHISANTLSFHHGKHHQAYVTNFNNLTKDSPLADKPLEAVIDGVTAQGSDEDRHLQQRRAGVEPHLLLELPGTPRAAASPQGKIAAKIDSDLGGYDKFAEAFKAAATTQFGSGWAWLVLDKGKLAVTKTANADTPLVHGQTAAAHHRRLGARLLSRLSRTAGRTSFRPSSTTW